MLSKGIANMTVPVEVARVLSYVDLATRYNWAMSNADLDIANELELTGIKKLLETCWPSWNRTRLATWLDSHTSNICGIFTKNVRHQISRPEYKRQARHKPKMRVILLCLATQVHSVLENGWKRYFGHYQVGKRTCTIFVRVGHQRSAPTGPYIDRGEEPRNKARPWNGKLIGKLLLTVTVAHLE